MEKIEHKNLKVNGINMHVAETGGGGAPVLLLHGFPELWYSWRHQMLHLSSKGYRAIAPDLRGYGESDGPPSAASYTIFHIVGDLVGLLDALGLEKVFLVGHDWGAMLAWWLCLLRPDRVVALVNTSVPFQPRDPWENPIKVMRDMFGDGYYVCRFQEPGEVEKEFASVETSKLIRGFFSHRDPRPLVIPKEIGFGAVALAPVDPPTWLNEEDVDYYAKMFDKTGFTGGLNYYRAIPLSWELTGPWTGAKVTVPTKFIVGDLDLVYHIPGFKEYIHGDAFKRDVPYLEDVVVMEGVAHFLNQEKPEELSQHIYDFFKKF